MKRLFLTSALVAFTLLPASAKEAKVAEPTMIPTSDATLKGLSAVMTESKNRQADLATRVKALEQQLAVIKIKAKNPKLEVGEQLAKEDLDSYNLLNAQLRYLQSAVTVEAVRQRNLTIAKDIYRASFFAATMMAEYIGAKGALDDDFDDYCRSKAKAYGLEIPVDLLFTAQDHIIESYAGKK